MTRRTRPLDPGPQPSPRPFNDAFAPLRDRLPAGLAPSAPEAAPAAKLPARAVVRLERKGRRGKEVTLVERLELGPDELARWADELKRSLGCGGGVEGAAVVVQGDQRERVARWLEDRGVRRVTRA